MFKIFIDGESGTTGRKLSALLNAAAWRSRIEIMEIPGRRDPAQRAEALNASDITVLCLPDEAAKLAVQSLKSDSRARIVDTSTAHRTAPGWAYGFPEISAGQPETIADARLVSNPGCYATGAIAILRPLQQAGLLPSDSPLNIEGFSGYTGGGKELIAKFEDSETNFAAENALRQYSLNGPHKHVGEIRLRAGLALDPYFTPHVLDIPQGMVVKSKIFSRAAHITDIHAVIDAAYRDAAAIKVMPLAATPDVLNLENLLAIPDRPCGVTTDMKIYVTGYDDADGARAMIVAEFDNLGKGAAGQAVQNLELMLGLS